MLRRADSAGRGFLGIFTVRSPVCERVTLRSGELKVVETIPYSDGPRAAVNCYGADDVREGVAIMWHENVDIDVYKRQA